MEATEQRGFPDPPNSGPNPSGLRVESAAGHQTDFSQHPPPEAVPTTGDLDSDYPNPFFRRSPFLVY